MVLLGAGNRAHDNSGLERGTEDDQNPFLIVGQSAPVEHFSAFLRCVFRGGFGRAI